MNLEDIKKWLTDQNERLVFIEDGVPSFVLMGFDAYRTLKDITPGSKTTLSFSQKVIPREDGMDIANARLEAERLRARELATHMTMGGEEIDSDPLRDPSEVRLEDLPL